MEADSGPNVAELRAILAYIEEHPEEWDQQHWARQTICGTSFCFAGHAVVRAGGRILWDEDGHARMCQLPGRGREPIQQAARRILGLSDQEADDLFEGSNYLEDVIERIAEIEANARRPVVAAM